MNKFNFTKEHFNDFSIIALNFNKENLTPDDLRSFKSRFNTLEWKQLKHNVVLECKKIIKYSTDEDCKTKAIVIEKAADKETLVLFFYDRPIKYNQVEGDGSFIPPKMITSKEIEDFERRSKRNDFDEQQFNDHTYKLFTYLVREYNPKKSKVKFINIWNFLKRDYDSKEKRFVFTQKRYREFIEHDYEVSISKFGKSDKYEDQEKGILNDLVSKF